MDNKERFKILTIDGGGIRGIFPAVILDCISQRLNINFDENVNMIAGTSTGAIIASAIACKIDSNKIISLYKNYGEEIFKLKRSLLPKILRPIIKSKYSNFRLKDELDKIFGKIKLGDINIPLIITSTDIGNGSVHVFRSNYSKGFTRDTNILLSDAVLASCSSPLFFNPIKVGNYLLADGGIWANNPSLTAVIDAKKRLNIDISNIKILSLGTGFSRKAYGVNANKRWGLITGWKGTELINFIMGIQAQSIQNYLQLLIKKEQLLRLNFETDIALPLDDCSKIDDLISRADRLFTYKSARIKEFFDN